MSIGIKVEVLGDGRAEIAAVAAQGQRRHGVGIAAYDGKQLAQNLLTIRNFAAGGAPWLVRAWGGSHVGYDRLLDVVLVQRVSRHIFLSHGCRSRRKGGLKAGWGRGGSC